MLLGVVDEVSAGLVRIPVEVAAEAAVFGVVACGYDQGQVDAHVLALEQELAELRWEQDDVAAQRRELAEQREQQNRRRPSVRALGDRMVQLMCLAERQVRCAPLPRWRWPGSGSRPTSRSLRNRPSRHVRCRIATRPPSARCA